MQVMLNILITNHIFSKICQLSIVKHETIEHSSWTAGLQTEVMSSIVIFLIYLFIIAKPFFRNSYLIAIFTALPLIQLSTALN